MHKSFLSGLNLVTYQKRTVSSRYLRHYLIQNLWPIPIWTNLNKSVRHSKQSTYRPRALKIFNQHPISYCLSTYCLFIRGQTGDIVLGIKTSDKLTVNATVGFKISPSAIVQAMKSSNVLNFMVFGVRTLSKLLCWWSYCILSENR